jgi:hypothetical protein
MLIGIAIFSPRLLGVIIFAVGFLLWLNNWQRLPVRVTRRFDLALSVTDLMLTTTDGPEGSVQVLGSVVNKGGAATILHSWALELQLPDRVEKGIHLADVEPEKTQRPSLSDATSVVPLPPGTLRGYLIFRFMRFNREDRQAAETSGVIKLSATDQSGQTWTFDQAIAPLVAIGREAQSDDA